MANSKLFIQNVSFKAGLPLEVEILPIRQTVLQHLDSISSPHRDNFYTIFWYQKGRGQHSIDFKPIPVKKNSLVFVKKDRIQLLDRKAGYDGKVLLFTDGFFSKYPEDHDYLRNNILFNDLLEEPVLNISKSLPLQSAFNNIEEELGNPPDPLQPDLLRNLVRHLLLQAERERRKTGFHEISKGEELDDTVRFKQLVADQFRTIKSVSAYALLMNISGKKLQRSTLRTLGRSPKELIDERILLEAKRLLAYTNQSIKEIGFQLGFDEPTNFIKYFKHHEKKTPIAFRNSFT